jgi:hypothetical protein
LARLDFCAPAALRRELLLATLSVSSSPDRRS